MTAKWSVHGFLRAEGKSGVEETNTLQTPSTNNDESIFITGTNCHKKHTLTLTLPPAFPLSRHTAPRPSLDPRAHARAPQAQPPTTAQPCTASTIYIRTSIGTITATENFDFLKCKTKWLATRWKLHKCAHFMGCGPKSSMRRGRMNLQEADNSNYCANIGTCGRYRFDKLVELRGLEI